MSVSGAFSGRNDFVGGFGPVLPDGTRSRLPHIPGLLPAFGLPLVALLLLSGLASALALIDLHHFQQINGYVFVSAGFASALFVSLENLAQHEIVPAAALPREMPFTVTIWTLALLSLTIIGALAAISDRYSHALAFSGYFAGLGGLVIAQFAYRGSLSPLAQRPRIADSGRRVDAFAFAVRFTNRAENHRFHGPRKKHFWTLRSGH